MFYLMAESDLLPFLSLLAFLPQLVLLCKTSFSFFRHPEFVFFINTAVFVTFNKVVTSQVGIFRWSVTRYILNEESGRRLTASPSILQIQLSFLLSNRPLFHFTHPCSTFCGICVYCLCCYPTFLSQDRRQ